MQTDDRRSYDRGVALFSPDGRLYQVEYAREAVRRGSPAVGVRTRDGVVLAANGQPRSPLVTTDSVEKLHDIDGRITAASAGHVADSGRLVDAARRSAQRERLRYGEPPGVETVARAVAGTVQETTQTGGTRPFGATVLLGGVDTDGPALWEIDPSGTPTGWTAAAIGGGADDGRAVLESGHADGLDTTEGLDLAIRALAASTDDISAAALSVATLDADGVDRLDSARRESLLDRVDTR